MTVLLDPPQADDVNVTMLFVTDFSQVVYPPQSYQQDGGEKAGITFSKSNDLAVNRYGGFFLKIESLLHVFEFIFMCSDF